IVQHIFFIALARAFPKTSVIHQYHVVAIAVKIFGIPGPSFYASAIAVKVKNKPLRLLPEKMQPVYTHSRCYIKKIFFEWNIIFEFKVGMKFLRFKNKPILQKIRYQRQED